jgi:SAM-dependent methyltransferase
MANVEIFDRALRRVRRDRAARAAPDFLRAHMADELLDRLQDVRRTFTAALDLGCGDGRLADALRAQGTSVVAADAGERHARAACGIVCDEDLLGVADASMDLVVSANVLDTVNDLPGALALVRRVLKPDGLFLGAFVGAGSLPRLRAAMLAADAVRGMTTPRIHPQVDVRSAGDLLARAGLALPVADGARLDVRYPHLMALVRDLRAMGSTNLLVARDRRMIGRAGLAAALEAFGNAADADGRVTEHFEIVYVAGWGPADTQPAPARRGSAPQTLAEAMRRFPAADL